MISRGIKDEFKKALEYIRQSPSDSPREPFKSMYQAGAHFTNALNTLQVEGSKYDAAILAQAYLLYELGKVEEFTEEPGQGTQKYQSALDLLLTLSDEITPMQSLLHLTLLNRLSISDSSRGQLEEAIEKLRQAEELYNKLRDKWPSDESIDVEEHPYEYFAVQRSEIPHEMLNSVWIEEEGTKTKHYLAQCYEHSGDKQRAAMYCHLVLKKQLQNRAFLSFYDPVDWAINAATLSQYFLFSGNYTLARHLLACAEHMMLKTKAETVADDMERIEWRSADVARCMVKYCVELLQVSRGLKLKADKGESPVYPPPGPMPVKLIDDGEVDSIESKLRNSILKTFEEAREIFLEGQKRILQATSYYSLKNRASDYVLIAQDYSELYLCLAAFETDGSRACRMHKRRLDLLEEIVKALNPKYYSAELQQVHFTLAEGYFDMVEHKSSCLPKQSLDPTLKCVKKINTLKSKSTMHFEQFLELIESFVVKDSGKDDNIAKYEESYVRPALVAHFSIGRLQHKEIVGFREERLQLLQRSQREYDYLDKYLKKYPEHTKYFEAELPMLKDLMGVVSKLIQCID